MRCRGSFRVAGDPNSAVPLRLEPRIWYARCGACSDLYLPGVKEMVSTMLVSPRVLYGSLGSCPSSVRLPSCGRSFVAHLVNVVPMVPIGAVYPRRLSPGHVALATVPLLACAFVTRAAALFAPQ